MDIYNIIIKGESSDRMDSDSANIITQLGQAINQDALPRFMKSCIATNMQYTNHILNGKSSNKFNYNL